MIGKQKDAKKIIHGAGGKAFPGDYNWVCPICGAENRKWELTCGYFDQVLTRSGRRRRSKMTNWKRKLNKEELQHLKENDIITLVDLKETRLHQKHLELTREVCRDCRNIAIKVGIESYPVVAGEERGTMKYNANVKMPPKMRAGIDFTHCTESKWCKNCSPEEQTDCEDKLQAEDYQRQIKVLPTSSVSLTINKGEVK